MIADLLQPHQRGEHQPAPSHALGLLGVGEQLIDHLLVERGLLAGQFGVGDLFDLVGQVGEQPLVGLGAPQDERLGDATQTRRGIDAQQCIRRQQLRQARLRQGIGMRAARGVDAAQQRR